MKVATNRFGNNCPVSTGRRPWKRAVRVQKCSPCIRRYATRAAGSGKVLFMGTDSAWRWRRGVEDKYHYRFWSQVVRWMAHQRHLSEKQGILLTFSLEVPQAGETVF